MRSRYYAIVALLIGSHLLTELHTFLMWANPKTITMYVDNWFLKPKFKVDHLSVLWYLKMIEDSLLVVAILFSGACQCYTVNYEKYLQWQRYSLRLYSIWVIYFAYHLFDLAMFLYNYKTTYWLYIIMMCFSTAAATWVAFFGKKFFSKNHLYLTPILRV